MFMFYEIISSNMISSEDAVRKLNEAFGKIDDNLFKIVDSYENFFDEIIVDIHVTRMIKSSYSSLRRIAEITGARDILIEKTSGDNLVEIKLMLPKK